MELHSTRRRRGATLAHMIPDSKSSTVRTLDRLNLRLPGETFEAIDGARQARPGNISRNTWITEAVEEKLAREHDQSDSEKAADRHA